MAKCLETGFAPFRDDDVNGEIETGEKFLFLSPAHITVRTFARSHPASGCDAQFIFIKSGWGKNFGLCDDNA